METVEHLFFHIAFYTSPQKNILGGKSYEATSFIQAIEKFEADIQTPCLSMVKYISCKTNMNEQELEHLKFQIT